MERITVLTPTGILGAGFSTESLARGMTLEPDVIALDAGSTDPGPCHLGSGQPLYSPTVTRRQLTMILAAARQGRVPLVIGSAGASGIGSQVDEMVSVIREIAVERGVHFKVAWIYADIEKSRVKRALAAGQLRDFEAGFPLTAEAIDETTGLVAQMGYEPLAAALDAGADVVIAGRCCDDMAIAALPILRGGDLALAVHMGKILECGALCAEPFGMDVMLGVLARDHFLLEPGSTGRRASVKSVASHSLYERENPFVQRGPGITLDLSACEFEQADERRVRVSGARAERDGEYWVKLEGAKPSGYRTICIAGVRCPTIIERIDTILDTMREKVVQEFGREIRPVFHVYGKDGVMGPLDPVKNVRSHELGLVMEVTAKTEALAHDACNFLGGHLMHLQYPGQMNTSGNLAFLYSPRCHDLGLAYEFSAYHLMRAESPTELFPIHTEIL